MLNELELPTELDIAQRLLARAQTSIELFGSSALDKSVELAADFFAAGIHVALVAHGSHALTVAFAAGQWHYADPTGKLAFGQTKPFTTERFSAVPPLPAPQPVLDALAAAQASAYQAAAAAELAADVAAGALVPDATAAVSASATTTTTTTTITTVTTTTTTAPATAKRHWLIALVAAGVIGLAAVALYYAMRKPARNTPARRKKRIARKKRLSGRPTVGVRG